MRAKYKLKWGAICELKEMEPRQILLLLKIPWKLYSLAIHGNNTFDH